MADGERSALGISVGATNLAAVTADRAVTRKPVLTLYRQRPPEVGVPSENPKLNEPGLVITDFVDRVGDPAGIAAADNTTHRSEMPCGRWHTPPPTDARSRTRSPSPIPRIGTLPRSTRCGWR
jgi:hypothetical protein